MAQIGQPWTDKLTGETVDSLSLATTAANLLMAKSHCSKERITTILPDELAWEWMMDDLTENRVTEIATYQFQLT